MNRGRAPWGCGAWRGLLGRGKAIGVLSARLALLGGIAGALLTAGLAVISPATSQAATPTPHLVFTQTPGTATAGSPFGKQPQVTVENKTNKAVTPGSPITLTVSGTSASLTGCTQSPKTGVVTFKTCEIDKAGTGYKLTAALSGYGSVTSNLFAVSPGPATQVVFSKEPTTITAGNSFTPPPQLTVEDAKNNPVTTGSFKLVLTAVTKTGQGVLTCSGGETKATSTFPEYELSATSGSATFGSCTIDKASATNYYLAGAATVGVKTPLKVESTAFHVNAGAPAELVFITNPNAALLAHAFGTQPQVAVEDTAGNVLTTVAGTISLSIVPNPTHSGATLTCTGGTTKAVTKGLAKFSGCSIDEVGTGYKLKASLTVSSHLITGTSRSFTVSAGAAAALTFVTEPGNGKGGSPLTKQPVVTIKDGGGDLVSGTVALSLETSTGGTPPAGSLLGCAANPAPAGTGTATFNCAVNKDGTYKLVASDPDATGATAAVSSTFTITTGPAAQVVFTRSPSNSTGGMAFTTQPTVSVEDLGTNPVPHSKITLGIAAGTGTNGAKLTCTGGGSATAPTGTVTFTGCAVDLVGTGYKLSATSSGITGESSSFMVSLGPPAKLEFTAQPSGGTVSTPLGGQPQVTVTDAGGNPEHIAAVPIALTSSTGSLACLQNPVSTNSTGTAAFAGCKVSTTGTPTLTAKGDSFTATSSTFTVVSGSPLGTTAASVPTAQTFGANTLGTNPTSVVDDVNSATGALDFTSTDLKMAAVGEPFTLARQYNSNDTSGGSFGPGWSSILDAGVKVTGGTALVRSADGQQLVFTSNGAGGWMPPPGARAALTCQGSLCTVTQFDGTVFQSVGGKIQDYLSADGLGLHFVYSHGRLTQITGSAETLLAGAEAALGEEDGALGWKSTHAGTANLNSVTALTNTQLWAVGTNCTIEFSGNHGSTWTQDTNVTGCIAGTALTSVFGDEGSGPVFAAGTHGTLLVCGGPCNTASASWISETVTATTVNFSSLWSPNANQLFVVGTTTGGEGEIWACSANCVPPNKTPVWKNVTPAGLGSTALTSISGTTGSKGFLVAVGRNGTILMCSSSTCPTSSTGWVKPAAGSKVAPTVTFSGVAAVGVGQVYAVGSKPTGHGVTGVIWACSNNCNAPSTAAWGDVTPKGLGGDTLTSVSGEGPNTAWAVGSNGEIWFCPANCTTKSTEWVSIGAPGGTTHGLAGVASSDSNDAWAVGAGGTVDFASGPSATLNAIQQAIAGLGNALTASLWVDGNHPSTALGSQVFTQTAGATQALWKLATPGAPSISTVPSWDAIALLDVSQGLRIVDANALSENLSNPKNASDLSIAQKSFTTGNVSITSGQYPVAVTDYQQAWTQALAAQGSGQGSHAPLQISVHENTAGEVTGISTPTRTVQYGYTGNLLTSYTDPDGNIWTYTYTAGLLTKVTDPTHTARLTVTYANGRVKSASETGSQTHFADTYAWTSVTHVSTRTSQVKLGVNASVTTATYLDEYAGDVLIAQQVPDGATTSYSYDANLDFTGMQDPLGRVDRMTYDAVGDVLTESSPAYGGTAGVTKTYNANHRVLSTTDANGNTTTYVYTGGNLVEVTPPPLTGKTSPTHYRYNYLGEEIQATGPTAAKTFTYDGAGNQTGYQLLDLTNHPLDGLGPVFSYDEAGQQTVSTDPRGHQATKLLTAFQTVDTYNNDGELVSSTSPGSQTTTTTYTTAGDVGSVTNPAGVTTTYSWNETKLQVFASNLAGTTVTTYDPSGTQLAQTSPGGATTTYTFDPTGRQVSKTGATGVTTFYGYDLEGNVVTASTSAGSSFSTYAYDPVNSAIHSTVNGATTSTAYDAVGNVTSQTDTAGRVTTFTYNSRELLASVTNAAGTTSYKYDLGNNLITVTDGNGHTVRYSNNGAGQRTAMTVAGNKTTYTYDPAGNLVSTIDPDGRTTHYTLNALNERTGIAYSQSGQPTINISQTFNAAGQRTLVTESTTNHGPAYQTTSTYNTGGDLAQVTEGSDTYKYTYSTAGKMVETYPDGTKVTYAYDDVHSLMSVSTTTGMSASYVRNAQRQVTGIAYSNGMFQSQAYNANGLETSTSLSCAGTTELTQATNFDSYGAPLSTLTTVGGTTTTRSFGYDAVGRTAAQSTTTKPATVSLTNTGCTTGSHSAASTANGSTTTSHVTTPTTGNQPVTPKEGTPGNGTTSHPISYDAVGDITSIGGTTITYNAADEVTSASGTNAETYKYDNNGDVTSKTVGGKTTTYSYNAADQLVAATGPNGDITYTYDGVGNRMTRTLGGKTTDYSWDPSTTLPLLTLSCSGACSTRANVVDQFIYGIGPVAMQTQSNVFYLHADQQGDVVAVSNNKGAILETYRYDALGNVTSTRVGPSSPTAEPLLFQSQYLTTLTGLYDMRARNYDPTAGTFTQRDPVTPGIGTAVVSPYAYANDQATSNADPTGNASASGMLDSLYYGHSTTTADIVGVTRDGVGVALGARSIYRTIGKYSAKAAAEAADDVKSTSSAIADLGPEYAGDAARVTDDFGGVAEAGSSAGRTAGLAAEVAGKGLLVAGFALGIYLTVEDCQHGTVSQCVGDSVGLALGLACAVAGETAAAVATFGAATPLVMLGCGALAAAIGMVISMFGPQIVQGLADLGGYAIEGYNYVASALQTGFEIAGTALTGAYAVVADQLSKGFAEAKAGLTNLYLSAVGVLSSGFNKLDNYLSSGFQSALSTLEGAGETALELANVLKNNFDEGLDTVVNQLVTLGYDVAGIAAAIAGAFEDPAQTVALILKGFDYTVTEIANGIHAAFSAAAHLVGQVLAAIGITIDTITKALTAVFTTLLVTGVAAVLKGLNYTVDAITGALKDVYTFLSVTRIATVLNGLNYTVNEIAGAIGKVYTYLATQVAKVLDSIASITPTEIADALITVFTQSATEAAKILKTIGITVGAVATALKNILGTVASTVVGILKTIGFAITAIKNALTSVFHLTTSAIISALSSFFTNTVISTLGGAFSSVGSFITTTVGSFFTTTIGGLF